MQVLRIERGQLVGAGPPFMCFSATASFSVAAVTAAIGVAAIRQAGHRRDLPLAAVPLLFASQQAVEGILWLQLSGQGDAGHIAVLSFAFLIFAEVIWPSYVALAALCIEPDRRRRRMLWVLAAFGFALSIYLLIGLLGDPPTVAIRGHSIGYGSEVTSLTWRQLPYLICTCLPFLLSSHRIVQILGVLVLGGFLVSAHFYLSTYVSVWCFFAAADSSLIYFHFRRTALAVGFQPS